VTARRPPEHAKPPAPAGGSFPGEKLSIAHLTRPFLQYLRTELRDAWDKRQEHELKIFKAPRPRHYPTYKELPKEVGLYFMINTMNKSLRDKASPKDREKFLPMRLKKGLERWRDSAALTVEHINKRIIRLEEAKFVCLEAAQLLEAEGPLQRKRDDLRLIWDKAINQLRERAVIHSLDSTTETENDFLFEAWCKCLPDDYRLPPGRPRTRKPTK